MPRVPIARRRSSPQVPQNLAINRFSGLNIAIAPTELQYNESPELLNVVLDDRGNINKRNGYQKVFETELDSTNPITGMHVYTKTDGTIEYLLSHNSEVYRWFLDGTAPTQIHTGLTNSDTKFFNFNELAYMINGNEYMQYDGTDFEEVDPYIPTIQLENEPNEEVNLLTGLFKQGFAGNGSKTEFQLALTGLDSTTVTAEVDGSTITEGNGLSVIRSTGVVEFDSAPDDAGGTINVTITASKTQPEFKNRVTRNNQFIFYGRNSTVLYLLGNPEFPNRIIFSDINRPNYFPENNFTDLGSNSTKVTGFSKQYDVLLIFKEPNLQDNTIFSVSLAGTVTPINDSVGCVNPDSIQVVENSPYFLSDKGVYGITNTEIQDERNVVHISDNIDRNINPTALMGLLDLGGLENYKSVDFDRKYILSEKTTGTTWVFDYRYTGEAIGRWFKWDNIYANIFIEIGSTLYFGDSRRGLIYKFDPATSAKNDNGDAINCQWRSKIFYFGNYTRYKLINRLFMTTLPGTDESVMIRIRTDRDTNFFEVDTRISNLFNYPRVNYATWIYSANVFPATYREKVKQKKINTFQIELSNNTVDSNMGVTDVTVQYYIHGENKGR